ncbi:HD family phosphohydrolase [cf. Phormidesmis sp. LEGE 11477]|uniref:HD family phosphohydrolase n=1 Tax=cf. Phormidesmis sp. LEGE 11477 TaxID=1828680 RepID=UPI00187DEBA7|nr:HDIG domain-containing metalloprotein [cf. Phormidesmis sp. LEGE 11477]MBE9061989.1 HDIG domain-containing protein [cf. Phormidesmis sp. LEGE 11477]
MRALRHVANRIRQVWKKVVPASFRRIIVRLKPSSRTLKKKVARRCSPLINGAQNFLLLGDTQPMAKSSLDPVCANAEAHTKGLNGQAAAHANGSEHTRPRPYLPQSPHHNRRPCARRSTGHTLIRSPIGSRRTWMVTLLAVMLLATCFGQRFYRQPALDVRSIAPQTFYAPANAVVEDRKATESRREAVRSGLVQVLRIDPEQTAMAMRSLNTLLQQGRELRAQAGNPPFLNLETLSQTTQDFLFQATEAQWQVVWRLAKKPDLFAAQVQAIADSTAVPTEAAPNEIDAELSSLTAIQKFALQELLAYRELYSLPRLAQLQIRLENRRQQYQKDIEALAAAANTEGRLLYNYRLFELSEEQWSRLETTSRQLLNEMMLQGISVGTPDDLLRRAIESRVSDEPDPEVKAMTAEFIATSVAPNLVVDEERTRQQAERAVGQIDPVMLSVEQGDLIVRASEPIDASDFVLLDYFGLTNRYFNWVGLCGFSVLITCAVAFYLWVDHLQVNQLNQRDHLLVLLLCLGVSVLAALKVPTIGLPAVGLLVGSFYGNALGVTVIGLLMLILPIGTAISVIPLVAGAAAALLGTWIAPQLRSREEFALLGGFVGLSQAIVHFILTLMRLTVAAPLWKSIFIGSALHGVYGIAWSVLALGVSPYLEHFFDVVTPIRLAELANPNRPLLKRLAAEAPGTFQHTMFVANLAESGARALGRNVELVRAGTLYHDIGKMHDPQSFIENQLGGPNKHDEIDDPWISAGIIRKHVTQGLVMARKYRLPQAVQAFIPEHQGDMKISYFYQQAKQRQEKEPSLVVNEADFSYDGPIPQSPETGITMLADSCEAALRSLKPEASMDEAYSLVNRILRARWRSRQLVDSGLSRGDMDIIASVFIQVWQQHNHKRIEYPKNVLV